MIKLLKKELLLSFHPTAAIFVLMAAMVLIPNYPYYVAFFYSGLAAFFTCVTGRENNDVFFSLMLPISKSDIVKARYGYVLILELAQLILAVGFAFLRSALGFPSNEAGIEANVAMFGISLFMLSVFNLIFFAIYYRNIKKPGVAAIFASVTYFLLLGLFEMLVFFVPFARDKIDTADPLFWEYKLIILAVGIISFVIINAISYLSSIKNFEKQDI
ncbi:MAG TPA: ABC-2 transporter permease [Bacilli bacterium]|nr:ABC-2 transporter permease [Bacilli bacterium]